MRPRRANVFGSFFKKNNVVRRSCNGLVNSVGYIFYYRINSHIFRFQEGNKSGCHDELYP
jgi:hypothetical protein